MKKNPTYETHKRLSNQRNKSRKNQSNSYH